MPTTVKKAQVTIFVIIAILIVTSVSMLFYFKTQPFAVPAQFKPVEDYFIGCIENAAEKGIQLLGSQGGYIEVPYFEPGSQYMPFSSQLDFFGIGIPYWFYLSGNNIAKQQVPSLNSMEKQLSNFLNEEVKKCDLSVFEEKGYTINSGDIKSTVKINEQDVAISIDLPLNLNFGDSSARITAHEVNVKSRLGKFYGIAKSIYDKEQKELFLENYSIDVLNLYAPVTNVELSCSPKVWVKNDVEKDIKNALEANIAAIKFKGSAYKGQQQNNYFLRDVGTNVDENVNLLYSGSWETRFEVSPEEGGIMTAKPVGNQQGLGILGFCYVPYHFVYDLGYPVMVQVYNERELFQFPMIVLIDKNTPRQAVLNEALPEVEAEMCNYKNTEMTIYSFDNKLKPVEADIKFKCAESICDIGKTEITNGSEEAYLVAQMPQCVNGFVLASAKGYADGKMMVSTNNPGVATVMLSKLHNLTVEMSVGLSPIGKDEQAIVSFVSDDYSTSVAYPQQKMIQLKEGSYNVSVYAFRKGSITIGAYTSKECIKTPKQGIWGLFGMQEEKCFDVNLPSQTLTQVPYGGGATTLDLFENELENAGKIEIDASFVKMPSNILELQEIYENIDVSPIAIGIK